MYLSSDLSYRRYWVVVFLCYNIIGLRFAGFNFKLQRLLLDEMVEGRTFTGSEEEVVGGTD